MHGLYQAISYHLRVNEFSSALRWGRGPREHCLVLGVCSQTSASPTSVCLDNWSGSPDTGSCGWLITYHNILNPSAEGFLPSFILFIKTGSHSVAAGLACSSLLNVGCSRSYRLFLWPLADCRGCRSVPPHPASTLDSVHPGILGCSAG